ncbi:MAG: LysR family transcriptional regulator [Alcaligenaceae bacterium]|nr:LysR family transcriptional regulator [Alcaligenaceae bacterium]
MDQLVAMRVFERVASEGGFAAAARAMDISPPVVTRLVAELESHLGTRLFQRTTRRVSLTDAGAAYLGRVRQILQDVYEADALASANTSALSGRLSLHTLPVLASYVVSPMLTSFRHLYPDIFVEIDVGAYRDLPIEDFDITLLGTDASFNADIVARKIIESEVILVASPAYVERRGAPQTPDDLKHHDCLQLRASDGSLRAWRLSCPEGPDQRIDTHVTPGIVANHTDTLLRAVLDGAGITSVAVDIVASYLASGVLVRVLNPWTTGRLAMYAALPSRKFIPQRSRVFLDYLVEHTRKQYDEAMKACGVC